MSQKFKLEAEVAALQATFYLVKVIGAMGTMGLGAYVGGLTHSIVVFFVVWFGGVWLFMSKIYEPFRESRLEALRSRYEREDTNRGS